ncbi:MAG: hypothetical protein B7Z71_10275 [Acidocella sp. 21-58-7]|nr:MAG: hypothetical protein B7Z71_10275 [Acidocella sp. 21-58-7]
MVRLRCFAVPARRVMPVPMTQTRSYTHQEILPVIRGVALAILLSALDQTIVVPAVPKMGADLLAQGHLSWIVAAYLLTGTAATPVIGKLSDIYGRRQLLQPAIIVFVVASLGCALAQNLPEMILLRAVQGIGGAGLITIAQTAIADVVPPRERGRYQIYMSGMWGIASIAGPIAGGALTDLLSWRAIFWINLPLGIIAYISAGRALRVLPPHAPGAVKIDYLGATLLMASITAWLVLCASGGHDFAWDSSLTAGLAISGLVLTALTIWQETRASARHQRRRFRATHHAISIGFCRDVLCGWPCGTLARPHQADHFGGADHLPASAHAAGQHGADNARRAVRIVHGATRRRHWAGAAEHHSGHSERRRPA